MSDGTHGHGTTLKRLDTSNATAHSSTTNWTAYGNIISFGGPNEAKDAIEISTMDSSTKFREFIPGMMDAGEITCELNYDGSNAGEANKLNSLFVSTASTDIWRVTINDVPSAASSCSYFQSVGFVTSLGHSIPFDDKVTQSLTLKLSGVPTFTDVPA